MNIDKIVPNQEIPILDIACRSDRFDIIFKIIFVKMLLNFDTSFNWSRELYANSIKVLNGAYEMPTIFQKKEKHRIADFFSSFEALILEIIKNGYDKSKPIPVTKEGFPLNGSHRIACATVLGKKITAEIHSIKKSSLSFTSDCFRDRAKYSLNMPKPGPMVINSMPEWQIDAGILEYIFIKKNNIRLLFLFGKNSFKDFGKPITDVLKNNNVQISHIKKTFKMNYPGILNLVREFYLDEPHVNVSWKSNAFCEDNNEAFITVLVLESKNLSSLNELSKSGGSLKTQIRKICNSNHHSIHVSATIKEVDRLSKTIFNNNSIRFLNKLNIRQTPAQESFYILSKNAQLLKSSDHLCFVSSIVLDLMGIRDAEDIDYISNKKYSFEILGQSHNHYYQGIHYLDALDLIYNPSRHFYFRGFKFAKLEEVYKFKGLRLEEPKDLKDLVKIESFINDTTNIN